MTLALYGKSRRRRGWLLGMALLAVSLGLTASLLLSSESSRADSAFIDFDSYADGNINGQDGWSKTGGYDVAVVDLGGGNKVLRASNAVTSGSFGDQTFSKSLVNEAGETWATNNAMSGGTRQNHYEVSWDIRSAVAAEQPGLFLSFSPDRGDGGRMSYLGVGDGPGGLTVTFYDVQQPGPCSPSSCANFVPTVVASNLDRTVFHNLKLVMDFKDGPGNDVVYVYVDGALVHTGTSWEDYFRYDPESSAEPTTRTVDSLLIRAGGSAAPATSGQGFYIDNLSLESMTLPDPAPVTEVVQVADLTAPLGGGWLFYNDENDTFDNTPGVLGDFVAGPVPAPAGTGSAEITVSGTQRRNLATYQFTGTPLQSITALGWSSYSTVANQPPFLNINVDFNQSDTWQRRLIYIPPTPVATGTWVDHDAIQGGAALWKYSGPFWPAPNAATPGSTALTWAEIQEDYPLARIRVTDAHVGIRVGHPTALDTANLDRFVFGTDLGTTIFDFEPTVACTTTCYVNAATGNDLNDGAAPGSAKATIQAAVDAVSPGGTVIVAAGTYNEDVTISGPAKDGILLQGAGIDQSVIVGPKGGGINTLWVFGADNVVVDGFTITRDGNNVADWSNANGVLNNQGVNISSGSVNSTLQNSRVVGNRNGVYVENSTDIKLLNNVIENNRTGVHGVDNVSGLVVTNNFIRDNWTMGILLRDSTPPAANVTANINVSHNSITGNWYSQVEARSLLTGAPLDFEENWYGTLTPSVVAAASSGEPGYDSQIPVAFGGAAVPLVSATGDIVWNNTASGPNPANPVDYQPFLCSGEDASAAVGFQPSLAGCGDIVITTNTAAVGQTGVTVQVIANNVANLYGVQAYLQYDNSKLQLTNVTLGPGLAPQFAVAMSQPGNQINFAFSQQAPTLPVSGSGIVLATLEFTAISSGAASIEFRATPPTMFSDPDGFSIGPGTRTNGSITVGAALPGTVTGTILLQGRTNHSGATAQIDPTLGPISGPSSSTGAFTINSVATGNHTLQGVMLGYLKATKPFVVAAGVNPAGTVTLLGGDANMDNIINILDLSFIAARFGQSGPVYAPVAPANTTPDINGDGIVNILDLSVTAANFAKITQTWP